MIEALKQEDEDDRPSAAFHELLETIFQLDEQGNLTNLRPHAEAAFPVLAEAMKDEDANVRGSICFMFSIIDAQAVPSLTEALSNDDTRVRAGTAFTLAGMAPDSKTAVPRLVELLGDHAASVRFLAAYALGEIGLDAYEKEIRLPEVTDAKEYDDYVRWRIACAMGRAPEPKGVIQALERAIADKDNFVRLAAVEVLGEFGSNAEAAVPALIGALDDDDAVVQSTAARSLGHIGPRAQASVPALSDALKRNSFVGRPAIEALKKIDVSALVSALIGALNDERVGLRHSAAGWLGDLESDARDAIPALTKALNDANEIVRGEAASALRRIDPKFAAKMEVSR